MSILLHNRILEKEEESDEDEEGDSNEEESTSSLQARNGFTAEQNACQIEALKLHNSLRARHSDPALVLDDAISRKAQAYAQYLASSGRFQHSSDRDGLGENLYSAWSSVATERTGFGKYISTPILCSVHFFLLKRNTSYSILV